MKVDVAGTLGKKGLCSDLRPKQQATYEDLIGGRVDCNLRDCLDLARSRTLHTGRLACTPLTRWGLCALKFRLRCSRSRARFGVEDGGFGRRLAGCCLTRSEGTWSWQPGRRGHSGCCIAISCRSCVAFRLIFAHARTAAPRPRPRSRAGSIGWWAARVATAPVPSPFPSSRHSS